MPFNYTCARCGIQFTKAQRAKSEHVYCSSDCYHAATKLRSTVKCKVCSKDFTPVGTRDRKFCSRECYDIDHAPEKVTKLCPTCNKPFEVNKSVAHRYKVCSIECRLAKTVYVTCKRCGKKFTGESKNARHYCSEECRRPPVILQCEQCGKDYRVVPVDATKRKYCCFACYRKSVPRTSIENFMATSLEILGYRFEQEHPVGRYCIDFALLEEKIAIEADGDYWHKDASRFYKKDKFLSENGWSVVRITETEIGNSEDFAALLVSRIQSSKRN